MKALLGLVLALSIGSCPLAMSFAAAAQTKAHACCPAPEQPAKAADCCVSSAAPTSVSLAAPQLVAVALPTAAPVLGGDAAVGAALESDTAPPGATPSDGPSSRAPPAVLA